MCVWTLPTSDNRLRLSRLMMIMTAVLGKKNELIKHNKRLSAFLNGKLLQRRDETPRDEVKVCVCVRGRDM